MFLCHLFSIFWNPSFLGKRINFSFMIKCCDMTHSGSFQAVVCNKQIKTELWEVKMIHCRFSSEMKKLWVLKSTHANLIPVNATKLKCLYIEMQQFEVKTTLWEGRKKGPVCPHWMDVIKFILVFIRNRRGICGDALNEPVVVCGSPHNGGLVSGSCILRRP